MRRWCSKATTGASVGTSGVVAQDFGAVDDVALHDRELVVGELVRLVEDLDRRPHLADVVHQRGEAELAQQRPVDAQPARLAHGQDRDVHHVGEGVVVVVLQRRQRQQRACGSAPPPAPGRRSSCARRSASGRPSVCALSQTSPAADTASLYSRLIVAMSVRLPSTRCSTVTRPTRMCGIAGNDSAAVAVGDVACVDRRDRVDEGRDLLDGDAAVDGDALDAALLQPADERAERVGLGHRHVVDDDLVADQADDDRRLQAVQQLQRRRQRLEVAGDDRMALRVELRRAQRRREAAQQLVGELQRAARSCAASGRLPAAASVRQVRAGGGSDPARAARRGGLEHGERVGGADARQRRGGGVTQRRGAARRPPLALVQRFLQRRDAGGIAQRAERLDRAQIDRRRARRGDRRGGGCRRTAASRARRAPGRSTA